MGTRVECALVRTEHGQHCQFRNVLELIGDLRVCSKASKYYLAKLPRMDLYTPTSNSIVNQIMKNAYIAFWQHLRRRHGYSQYMRWLIERSKGTVLSFQFNATGTGKRRKIPEAHFLKPLFKGSPLNKLYSECLLSKTIDPLMCLKEAVESNVHDHVEREMSLTANWFLNLAVNVATTTNTFPLTERDLKLLRSADSQALECIRDWDRIYSIPKVLYLSFLLHARNIISHLMNNQEESQKMLKMESQLNQIVITELPSNMIKEVKREQISAGGWVTCFENMKHTVRAVKEIRLLLVKQALKEVYNQRLFLDDDCVLYISMNEGCYDNDLIILKLIFDSVKRDAINGNLNMDDNPSLFNLQLDGEDGY